jgi:endoglucanase
MNRAGYATQAAAEHFLATYLTADGRVLRHDQGGDIVSEGQAYGMLIAQIAGQPATVRRIWAWTKAHLSRSDGLLAFHATSDGEITSHEPAADADVLAAYALLRYDGLQEESMHADGCRLAAAVFAEESVSLPTGEPIPVAGRWAAISSPPMVNPSYWMPGVFTAVARYTGDGRWSSAASASESLLCQLTDGGRLLPPDWAHLEAGRLTPAAAPGSGPGIRYGLDAARLPLWLATGDSEPGRRLAASWWTEVLSGDERAAGLALSLTGEVIDARTNPLPLLAAAATAAAAGDLIASRALRTRAIAQGHGQPTYYGDAWLTIGGRLLDGAIDPYQDGCSGHRRRCCGPGSAPASNCGPSCR